MFLTLLHSPEMCLKSWTARSVT